MENLQNKPKKVGVIDPHVSKEKANSSTKQTKPKEMLHKERFKIILTVLGLMIAAFVAWVTWDQAKLMRQQKNAHLETVVYSKQISAIKEINSAVVELGQAGRNLVRISHRQLEKVRRFPEQSLPEFKINKEVRDSARKFYEIWQRVVNKVNSNEHLLPNKLLKSYKKYTIKVPWNREFIGNDLDENSTIFVVGPDGVKQEVFALSGEVIMYGRCFVYAQKLYDKLELSNNITSRDNLISLLKDCSILGDSAYQDHGECIDLSSEMLRGDR